MRQSVLVGCVVLALSGCVSGEGVGAEASGSREGLAAMHFPNAPQAEYLVEGQATAQLSGAHCCGGSGFPGEFRFWVVMTDRGAQIRSGEVRLFDTTQRVTLSTGEEVAAWFESMWDRLNGREPRRLTMTIVDGFAVTQEPALGVPSGTGGYAVPGGIVFTTGAYANRAKTQEYVPMTERSTPVAFTFDPRPGGAFELRTSYPMRTREDGVYTATVLLRGHTVNTPTGAFGGPAEPSAVIGAEPKTAGCPSPRHLENYVRPGAIDMTSADGVNVEFLNASRDAENNILGEQFVVVDASGNELVRTSQRRFSVHLPPGEVAWEVREVDTKGAESRYLCEAIVEDISAPKVQVRAAPSVFECSEWGGASARTNAELAAWLGSAAEVNDVVDGALTAHATFGGGAVTESTLFPLGSSSVAFESTDAAGNTGRDAALLSVVDSVGPTGWAIPNTFGVPGDGDRHGVQLSVGSWDACSASRWTLYKVLRDGQDAGDSVSDAEFGTPDAYFKVQGIPGANYTVVVQVVDASGNASFAVTNISVQS